MDFVAMDFETANTSGYPCALGVAVVRNNKIVMSDSWLINPQAPFSDSCVAVHNILPSDVTDAPVFADVWEKARKLFDGLPIVAHNASFDVNVLRKALSRAGLPIPDTKYYCTLTLARQLCREQSKFTLDNLCSVYGICLNNHHNCEDDAIACANLMIKLATDFPNDILPNGSLKDIPEQHNSVSKVVFGIQKSDNEPAYAQGNAAFDDVKEPILFEGKNFVITGEFSRFTRKQLCDYISSRGGNVKAAVSKKTNYLLVGIENLNFVSNPEENKSSKILKAEELEASGIDIIILNEDQFLHLSGIMNT